MDKVEQALAETDMKADFDVYMKHLYYMEHIDKLGTEYFGRSTFIAAQFEF